MKKTLSIILVAVLMISALASLIVVPASAEGEGNWDVMLPAPVMNKPEDERQPAQGYYYDETGFHSVSPNYTNYNPHFTVISKEMYNITNFSMTVVVTDYCTEGDNWLSFSVWSESNGLAQGVTSGEYGDGWTSLIRPDSEGNLNRLESWNMTKGGRTGRQQFTNIDATQAVPVICTPEVDSETGAMTFVFAITDGVVTVNGAVLGASTDACIAERFKEGLAYVGVTLNNTSGGGKYSPTISVIDVNGTTPAGSDSRDPEGKVRVIAPITPSDTVPANTPAVWFDGTLTGTNNKLPSTSNCDSDYADDNESILITALAPSGTIQFFVPDTISYEANDFPYFMIVFKNFCTCSLGEDETPLEGCMASEAGAFFYCAGEVTAPRNDCMEYVPMYYYTSPIDDSRSADDYYTVVIMDLSALNWEGRINSVRFDFSGYSDYVIDGRNTFEIIGAGAFAKSEGAANYLTVLGLNAEEVIEQGLPGGPCDHFDFDEDGICDICDGPVNGEEETEEPVTPPEESSEAETNAPEESSEAETNAPEESSEAETNAPEETTEGDVVVPEEESSEAETNAPEETTEAPTVAPEVTTEAPVDTADSEDTTVADTAAPEDTTVADTAAPEDTTAADTAAPEDTTVADTAAPEDTTAADTTAKEETTTAKKEEATTKAPATSDDAKTEEKKGCGSSVAMGALAIVAIVGTGVVLKKKEN